MKLMPMIPNLMPLILKKMKKKMMRVIYQVMMMKTGKEMKTKVIIQERVMVRYILK
jgi:hypothetical protein